MPSNHSLVKLGKRRHVETEHQAHEDYLQRQIDDLQTRLQNLERQKDTATANSLEPVSRSGVVSASAHSHISPPTTDHEDHQDSSGRVDARARKHWQMVISDDETLSVSSGESIQQNEQVPLSHSSTR